jgi:uncharacterized membrane protein
MYRIKILKMKKYILIMSVLVMAIASCSKKEETKPQEETKVKYKNDEYNVMNNNCITCHSGNTPSAGLDLSTYENVKNATQNSTLLQRVNDANAPMPPVGLMPEDKRKLLSDWKNQGYLE